MEVDSTSRISKAQTAASKAEREAADRITESRKQIQETTKEEEARIDAIKDQYEKRGVEERARGENYIESVRNRSYESLGELRRKSQSEEMKLKSEGEKNVNSLKTQYKTAADATANEGEARLGQAVKTNFKAEEAERKRNAEQLNELKSRIELEKRMTEEEHKSTTENLGKASQQRRKELEAKTRTDVEASNEHYKDAYEGAVKQNQNAIKDVNWRASQEVEDLKRNTALKLDSYSSQKNDPFYKMVNLNATLHESDEAFVLKAKVPPHERDRININVSGNDLIISGKRKSEESVESENGTKVRTNSYQSFSESFPLNWSVDAKSMTREWSGNTLVVRIPKRATYEAPKKKEAERTAAQRPNFPKNLPTEQQLVAVNADTPENADAKIPPSKRKSGSVIG